jgi:hypothetical protein
MTEEEKIESIKDTNFFNKLWVQIAKYFRMILKKFPRENGLICQEQKGFNKNIQRCCDYEANLSF